jgi:arylsulfatase A-like enzyme
MMPWSNHSSPNRRDFIKALGSGTAAVALSPLSANCEAETKQRRRPNVIYAFSDEHRWQSMSIGEMPTLHTPNMARLGEQGASFVNAISNYPVCSPHRAILMTGRWPHQQGVIDNKIQLSTSEMTVAKAFKSAGYTTGYIGKWHLGGQRAEPFGFDHSLIWTGTGNHWKSAYHRKNGKPVVVKDRYNATVMTDQALAFVEKNKNRAFFLMVSWNPPHSRFTDAPKDKKALYKPGSLPRRPNDRPIKHRRKQEPRGDAFGMSWDI